MSRTYGLVRFNKTGNIYFGCYNGTSDVMIPYICTPEECYDEKVDCYLSISYCQDLSRQHGTWEFPDNVDDLDEIEIYSDYGGGFYWPGIGSESVKMIKDYLNPYEECYDEMTDGQPDWVKQFWIDLGCDEED